MSEKETAEAGRLISEANYKIYTRYIKDIEESMLIEYKGRIFEIYSILNKREQNELLQFLCKERKSNKIDG